MIDFGRAIQNAWERMTIILFQPFDIGKWGLLGFTAFLALLSEGGVAINNPFSSINRQPQTQPYTTYPQSVHAFRQFMTWASDLPNNPWLEVIVCVAGAYLIIWLVLNWVGCRAQFVFLDNIVRNRAVLVEPWQRYGRQGNIWFIFHLGIGVLSFFFLAMSAGVFLFLNWTWISTGRDPAGAEIAVAALIFLVFFVLGIIGAAIRFLIYSMVLPLYFTQRISLGAAVLAVFTLLLTRPVSMFIYLLLSLVLAILSFLIGCFVFFTAFCATLSIICWVSCFPFLGSMLLQLMLCELILPLLVFKRCFQLSVLEQFGPPYDVFRIDAPPTSL